MQNRLCLLCNSSHKKALPQNFTFCDSPLIIRFKDALRAYNLRTIKIEPAGGREGINPTTPDVGKGSVQTISDLYKLVKTYDKSFTPGKEVHPALLNEDGTPRVFYHGTLTKGINEFKKEYIGSRHSGFDETGFFFIDRKSIADDYAHSEFNSKVYGEIISAYLSIENPFAREDSIGIWDAYQRALLDEIEEKNTTELSLMTVCQKWQLYLIRRKSNPP